jgi:hypothetical protein
MPDILSNSLDAGVYRRTTMRRLIFFLEDISKWCRSREMSNQEERESIQLGCEPCYNLLVY